MLSDSFFNHKTGGLLHLHVCPICLLGNIDYAFKVKTINTNSDITAQVFKCADCFHWFINPIPDQSTLLQLYADTSPFVIGEGWDTNIVKNRLLDNNIAKENISFWFLKKIDLKLCGNYLEIGIGSGNVINYFKSKGWDCFGIEPGPWGETHSNIYPEIGSLPAKMQFDLVIANDVLEHVQDPLILLKQLAGVLNINGLICISVPYSSSIRAKLTGRFWRCVRPFGHLHFFSKKSLRVLADTAGLEIIFFETSELFENGVKSTFSQLFKSVIKLQFKNSIRYLSHLLFAVSTIISRGDQVKIVLAKNKGRIQEN